MKKHLYQITAVILTFALTLAIPMPASAFIKEPTNVDPPGLMSLADDPDPAKRELAYPVDFGMDQGPKLYGKSEYVGPPKMGWNSWNAFWTQVNDENISGIADSFVRLGLDKAGYEYVVVDDGNFHGNSLWNQRGTRDPETSEIQENLDKFPNGFKANVDYVHSLGLKYGMYGDVGTATCNGFHSGSWGYEDLDAMTYAKWGVDYIKYDTCNNPIEGIARRCYSPYLRSVTVSDSDDFSIKVAAKDGELKGQARLGTGANANDVYYIGAGPRMSGSTGVSGAAGSTGYLDMGELILTVEVPEDGNYKLEVEYAGTANGAVGYGRWLQVDVNGNGNRLIDQYVPATANISTFSTADLGNIPLKAGKNTLRFCNFGRMEIALYQYAAFADGMAKATEATGHEMILSLCEWGVNWPWAWGYKLSDSWRTTNDIMIVRAGGYCFWKSQYYNDNANVSNSYSVLKCYNENVILDEYAGMDRGWNDADMLVVGCKNLNYTTGSNSVWPTPLDIYKKYGPRVGELSPDGTTVYIPGTTTPLNVTRMYRDPTNAKSLTFEQEESHFNAWAMMNSPLMLGFDLRELNVGDSSWKIISNEDVIALNQDLLGVQAKRVKIDNPDHILYPDASSAAAASIQHLDALAKPLENGDMALMFFNLDDAPRSITLTMDEIVNNKDAFANKSLAPKIVNKAGEHDNGSAFLNASNYNIKDLRTKKATTVTNTGKFGLSRFDSIAYVEKGYGNSTPGNVTPTEYTSEVTFENGEFIVTLAPHASVTYRISYSDDDTFTFDYDDLTPGLKTTATALLTNDFAEDINAAIVLARYEESGKLADVVIGDTKTIQKGNRGVLIQDYYLPEDASDQTLKAFLWDLKTFKPLYENLDQKIFLTPAYKTTLANTIQKASEYDLSLYSLVTGAALTAAIEEAQAVYDNDSATQAEVNTAVDLLTAAIKGLAAKPKLILAERIAEAKAIDLSRYDILSGEKLTIAIAAAQAVYDNPNATEAEAQAAIDSLNAAIKGLATVPPRELLAARITEAKAIDLTKYNLLTGDKLTIAITAAQAVYDNSDATEAEAQAAVTSLETAIKGLVAAPVGVDRSLLDDRIAYALSLSETDYILATWTPVATALANAIALPDSATQAAVNSAANALKTALAGLEFN